MTVETARNAVRLYQPMMAPKEEVAEIFDAVVPAPSGDVPVRVYRPNPGWHDGILVYFHGGGWTLGDLDTADASCRALAKSAACVVVSVDYRLAPENKFPAAIDDAWAATQWVVGSALDLGSRGREIAVGGESSGGNLAAAVALRARADRVPGIALQLLVYPVLNFDFSTPSYGDCAEGFILTRKAMEWYWGQYLASPADGANVYASPLRAKDLSGIAPALIFTGEYDPLRDEAEQYGHRLTEAGVATDVIRCDGQIHGFFAFGGITVDAAHLVVERSGARLRAAFAHSSRGFRQDPARNRR